jgi:cyclophilin family peptidyl-prolyl cis-trans isomerase
MMQARFGSHGFEQRSWTNKHSIFGQVVEGQSVVRKVANVIRDSNDKPRFPIKLVSVQIIRVAPPAAKPDPDPEAAPSREAQ